GIYTYTISAGTWSLSTFNTNGGRHNGRSLSEMILKRDSRLYILCEDVTVTGTYNVANSFGATTNVNWQVMCYDPTATTWNTSKINGTTLLQYGTNMGPNAALPNQTVDFWFYNINAFLHDVAPNALLIQSNWTAGAIQVLDTA